MSIQNKNNGKGASGKIHPVEINNGDNEKDHNGKDDDLRKSGISETREGGSSSNRQLLGEKFVLSN